MKHIDAIGHEVVEHPDDIAINRFAVAMKAKMAKQRAKGYGGWNDPASCPTERLQQMLADHIPKGDPVDVGNFAMMLWNRGGRTEQSALQQEPYGWKVYGVNSLFVGEFAEYDARTEAKRIGGTCVAFPLYTSPPASKPLTDAQIGDVAAEIWGNEYIAPQSYRAFARAIEAEHGIKEGA